MSAGSTEGDEFPLGPELLILLFNKEKRKTAHNFTQIS